MRLTNLELYLLNGELVPGSANLAIILLILFHNSWFNQPYWRYINTGVFRRFVTYRDLLTSRVLKYFADLLNSFRAFLEFIFKIFCLTFFLNLKEFEPIWSSCTDGEWEHTLGSSSDKWIEPSIQCGFKRHWTIKC